MISQAELELKSVVSLFEEIEPQITSLAEKIKRHNNMSNNPGAENFIETMVQGFTRKFGITKERNALLQKCNQMLSMASNVKSSNPNMQIIVKKSDGDFAVTVDMVIAGILSYKGILNAFAGKLRDAHEDFKLSLKTYPMADTQLKVGYLMIDDGERNKALDAFQKVITDYTNSPEAVEARKEILKLEQIKPKKWRTALFLSVFCGVWGVDRFYLGYIELAVLKFFTAGGFFVWWIIDIIRIFSNQLRDANGLKLEKDK